jgi:hypothetical protein
MANNFPLLTVETFDDGTSGGQFTETLASGKGTFELWYDLVRDPNAPMPYRGSGVFKVNLAASTTDCHLQETDHDLTTGTDSGNVRFYFYVSKDLVMADADQFQIMSYFSGGGTSAEEGVVAIRFTTAAGFQVGVGEKAGTVWVELVLGEWHSMETFNDPHASAGTFDWWLDGQAQTQITGMANSTTTSLAFGVREQDSGTSAGAVYFDQIAIDDDTTAAAAERIGPFPERYPQTVVTNSTGSNGHQTIFVGPGVITNISLIDGGNADSSIEVYDTDSGSVFAGNMVLRLEATAANEIVDSAHPPIHFKRGCYIFNTGTAVTSDNRVSVTLGPGAAYSDGAMRTLATGRRPNQYGVS